MAAFFGGSLLLIPFLPTGFIPVQDKAQTQVKLTLPPGGALAETSEAAQRASALLAGVPGVRSVFISAGAASSGGGPRRPCRPWALPKCGTEPLPAASPRR